MLAAVGETAHLVSNLPYNVAVPIVAECLASSWAAAHGEAGTPRFQRLTFTVQKEVADRLTAAAGSGDYGPVSVLVALLGKSTAGPILPASAFWPKPKVASRIVRIDFDAAAADGLADLATLRGIVQLSFGQRRKKLGTILRHQADGPALLAAATAAGVDLDARAERIEPRQFAAMAAAMGPETLQ
jgi:16S rRNA (adenine1518-N6/adenine1519-N6)-dimethyltransferase